MGAHTSSCCPPSADQAIRTSDCHQDIETQDSLSKSNDRVVFMWTPASPTFELGQRAKRLARDATEEGWAVQGGLRYAKTTALSALRRVVRAKVQPPTAFGDALFTMDAAWPGDHTRRIYDCLSKKQVSILAQLHTGMTPLHDYLHLIKAHIPGPFRLREDPAVAREYSSQTVTAEGGTLSWRTSAPGIACRHGSNATLDSTHRSLRYPRLPAGQSNSSVPMTQGLRSKTGHLSRVLA